MFSVISSEVAGVWADNAAVDERLPRQHEASRIRDVHRSCGWQGLYFGGVAFKYQRNISDEVLPQAARLATAFMDVLTTSGPGTGVAAAQVEIRTLREAIGGFPLAIASGITPANVGAYLPYADCFLVATGISRSFSSIDPDLLQQLMDAVRSYEAPETRGWDAGVPSNVCFVCEWNEGRSAHLELSVRNKLRQHGSAITVSSAGLPQGGGVSSQRRAFFLSHGIPDTEIDAHRSRVVDRRLAETADLVLVAELPMKYRILSEWPGLHGKVMTVRGFVAGDSPRTESLTDVDAHIQDTAGRSPSEKQRLYEEVDGLATAVAGRLVELGRGNVLPTPSPRTDDDLPTEARGGISRHKTRPGTPVPVPVAVVSNHGDHHDYSYEVERCLERGFQVLYLGPIGADGSHSLIGLIESGHVLWVYGRHDDRCSVQSREELVIRGWRFRFFPELVPPSDSEHDFFAVGWGYNHSTERAAAVLASTDAPVTVVGSGHEFEHWSCPISSKATIGNTKCEHHRYCEGVVWLSTARQHLVVTPSVRTHRVAVFDLPNARAIVQRV